MARSVRATAERITLTEGGEDGWSSDSAGAGSACRRHPGARWAVLLLRVGGVAGDQGFPSLVSPSMGGSPWVQEPGRNGALTHADCAGYETSKQQACLCFSDKVYNAQWQTFI